VCVLHMASPARCTAWIGISLTHGYLTSCPCFRRLHGRAGIVSSSAVPSNKGPHQDTTNFSAPRSRSAHEEFGAHYENHGPSSAQRHRISPPPRHAPASPLRRIRHRRWVTRKLRRSVHDEPAPRPQAVRPRGHPPRPRAPTCPSPVLVGCLLLRGFLF
jgi:hypothetical protein